MTAPAGGRLPSLDAIRGLAFLVVFGSHAGWPGADGALGVTVFFFLSGFLITTLLLREEAATGTIDLRAFWARRALRILPVFYLVLGATAVLTLVAAREAELRAGPLLAQALHGSNYLFAHAGERGTPIGTDIYWSLAVEEHFYAVFPLLALLAVRRRLSRVQRAAALLGLCTAVLLWRWAYVVLVDPGYPLVYLRTYLASDMRVDGILWGALLAVVLRPERLAAGLHPALVRLLLPAGLLALFLTTAFDHPEYELVWQTTLQAISLTAVFTALLVRPPRLLQARPLVWLGAVSYAAYLAHRAVLEGLDRFLGESTTLGGLVGLAVTLLAAEASRRLVEQPLARLRHRPQGVPATPALTPAA